MANSELCELCKDEAAANIKLSMQKFKPANELLQRLFDLFHIEAVVNQLGNIICETCMAEVLNMCEILRCWQQAQKKMKNAEKIHNDSVVERQITIILSEEDQESLAKAETKVENYELISENNIHYELIETAQQSEDEANEDDDDDDDAAEYESRTAAEGASHAVAIANDGTIIGKIVLFDDDSGLEIVCNYCILQYKRINSLQSHCMKHEERTYICRTCGILCDTPAKLQQHVRLKKHATKPKDPHLTLEFRCQQCGRLFDRFYTICRHLREVHRSEANHFKCKECGETFKYKLIYEKHVNKHTGINTQPTRLFHCQECGKSFARNYQLTTHSRMHTGEKPYECVECKKSFANRGNYMQHYRSMHKGIRPYECDICLARFSTTTHLKVHQQQHNNNVSAATSRKQTHKKNKQK